MNSKNNMKFKTYAPLNNVIKKHELNKDGTLTIEGIASTTNEDLQKDIVLTSAIESMKKQLTNQRKNLHGDHEYGLFNGAIGVIKEVLNTDENTLKIRSTILSKYAKTINEMLNIGMSLGLSIGGEITDYTTRKNNEGWEIKNLKLFEISLTAMPANWDTYGTVTTAKGLVKSKCISGACYTLLKNNMERKTMPENNEPIGFTEEQKKEIADLLNEGLNSMKEEVKTQIINEFKNEIKTIATDAAKEVIRESDTSSNPEPAKNINKEELIEIVNKSIDDKLGDNFVENLAKNIFGELNNTRAPATKFDEYLKSLKEKEKKQDLQKDDDVVKTYTTEETAKILLKKQQASNPFYSLIK